MRGRRRRRGGLNLKARHGALTMTSLMDILTTLLFFLLKSFVADGGPGIPPPEVLLPESSSREQPEVSLVIAVSDESILLGDQAVARTADAIARDGIYLQELGKSLDDAWAHMEDLAKRKGTEDELAAKITIQGDREIEFQLLQKVMFTCNQHGFDQIALAVVQGS
jgi:biopolymer transport protein ExbD